MERKQIKSLTFAGLDGQYIFEPAATDEKYFGVTDDGMIYLLPEYRGYCPAYYADTPAYAYAVSDNGADQAGSKNSELPKSIVIPDMIGDIPVNELARCMFYCNDAVKRVQLPEGITKIPAACFGSAWELEEITGTDGVVTLGSQAFTDTKIKKALFPKLETMGVQCFAQCVKLRVADIGNATKIPDYGFFRCIRLHTLRNGANVETVGTAALHDTGTLKTPRFVPNLKNIGAQAFLYSRASYDWAALQDAGCVFGENATALQINPVDYWSGKNFTACEIPVRSTFDQENPEWAETAMGEGQMTWGGGGCTMCACAVIYSAYEGKDLAAPAEFVAAALAKDPTLAELPIGVKTTQIRYLEAMGYTVETVNAETGKELTVGNDLQYMYDALAAGHFIFLGVTVGSGAVVSHCAVVYGINENGELLVVDSNGKACNSGEYNAYIHPTPVQNITRNICDFMVVKKN